MSRYDSQIAPWNTLQVTVIVLTADEVLSIRLLDGKSAPERNHCGTRKQELREMVIRGAHEHPGAVAVEDELGRVILLHKLPREVTALPAPPNALLRMWRAD